MVALRINSLYSFLNSTFWFLTNFLMHRLFKICMGISSTSLSIIFTSSFLLFILSISGFSSLLVLLLLYLLFFLFLFFRFFLLLFLFLLGLTFLYAKENLYIYIYILDYRSHDSRDCTSRLHLSLILAYLTKEN